MTTANVVFSGPASNVRPLSREAKVKAAQTIAPGDLVEYDSGEWQVHSTEGQGGDFYIADMNVIEQKSVTEALTAGQSHKAFVPEVGCTYNLTVGASQTIVLGTLLTSAGDGTVKVAETDGTEAVLFSAEEEITTGGGESARVRARYIGSTISVNTTE